MPVDEIAEIEYVDPTFQVHEFTHSFLNMTLTFEIVKMKDASFIWIGDVKDPQFSDLSIAIKSIDSALPLATKIIGTASTDTTSNGLSQRLNKKLKRPVYVSFNVPVASNNVLEEIENRINEEIGVNPHVF